MWRERWRDRGNEMSEIGVIPGVVKKKGRPPVHGESSPGRRSGAYVSWCSMTRRCLAVGSDKWLEYGAKGVTVCSRWRDYKAFLADMGPRPRGTTLDRIDNSRGYEPGNCRWATSFEQTLNRRNTRYLTAAGKRKTITEWSLKTGLKYCTIWRRKLMGWSDEDALGFGNRGHIVRKDMQPHRLLTPADVPSK